LDPGLAFGSGTHPPTDLCLQWLDGLDVTGKTVLDFGCGSGILALAALKLGASHAIGVDNDPQALLASVDNADRNGVGSRLQVFLPDAEPVRQYPIVVANILASALIQLTNLLASRVQAGGLIALSGILHNQADEVLASYQPFFEDLQVMQLEDWVRISGRRKA
jgi:ribosomal protein L11 methyltransferase